MPINALIGPLVSKSYFSIMIGMCLHACSFALVQKNPISFLLLLLSSRSIFFLVMMEHWCFLLLLLCCFCCYPLLYHLFFLLLFEIIIAMYMMRCFYYYLFPLHRPLCRMLILIIIKLRCNIITTSIIEKEENTKSTNYLPTTSEDDGNYGPSIILPKRTEMQLHASLGNLALCTCTLL